VLRGNDPAVVDGQIARGQRVFCSDRGQRGGCGKTFSLFLAGILPRHTFNTTLLWALLRKLLAGATIQSASEILALPFSLEAGYGIVRRCRHGLDVVRSLLAREQRVRASQQSDPFFQTLEHLQQIFPPVTDALAAYQQHFQQPFLR
jgi:hypothetical protein